MRRYLAMRLLAFAFLLAPMGQAMAWECCDPWGAVGMRAFISAGKDVVVGIGMSVTDTVTSIRSLSMSLDTGFAKGGAEQAKQAASQKVVRQGAIASATSLYMQSRAGEAAENAVQPAGVAVTVTNSLLLSEQQNVVRRKITAADAAFVASVYGTTAASEAQVVDRHALYCSAGDVAAGRCASPASPTMQNADLMFNTIVSPGEGQYETLSDEERNAANAFVRQVINPVATARQPARSSTPADRALEARLLADQAALSVAAHSFNAAIAHRTRRHQQ